MTTPKQIPDDAPAAAYIRRAVESAAFYGNVDEMHPPDQEWLMHIAQQIHDARPDDISDAELLSAAVLYQQLELTQSLTQLGNVLTEIQAEQANARYFEA
ncbi:MAG: hypothetical protein OXN89_06390 [Bryobacterales bacterium]|nr:hypothetical protein [Bryobacterales bacterium]